MRVTRPKPSKQVITTIDQDLEQVLTKYENTIYACEHKVKWPDLCARKELNEQLKRDLLYVKGLQQKYPRRRPR